MATLLGAELAATPTAQAVTPQRTFACRFTAQATGTLEEIVVQLGSLQGIVKVYVGIYEDAAGFPGTLLEREQKQTVNGAQVLKVPIPPVTVTQGATYWLAALSVAGGKFLFPITEPEGGEANERVSEQGNIALKEIPPEQWGPLLSRGPEVIYATGTITSLVKRRWAGPFIGLYRNEYVKQGATVEVPPFEAALSPWFN